MKRIIVQLIIALLITGAVMTTAQNFKSGYESVNGIKMYYEIHGEGAPLVLIHGGGSTIESTFGYIIPSLASDFEVIAVELQAHGRTGDRDAPESFEQDADDVAALLSRLKISKASFLGFSNGGNTAIQIAVRHTEIVDKLVLASTFYKREGLVPGMFEGMKQATLNDMPQSLKDAFLKVNPDSSKLLNMFNKDRERMLNFKDWDDKIISSIKAPTLIINGDRDVILTSHALEMSKLITGSRLMILPAEHGAYLGAVDFRENPDPGTIDLTAQIIKNFLNNP
jgi:pimeloyl-ACP methyl ester carboxylesterase